MHQGEFVQAPCCPLWGKCRDSGKGGVVSNFEMLPFNEQHPLSQPVRAASSPIGEPRATAQPPLKGEDGATAPEGFPAVRRIPFRMSQGEFVQSRIDIVRIRLRFYITITACRALSVSLCSTAPPSGEPSGLYGFALAHFKWYSAYRKPLRHANARPSSALH